MSAFGLWEILAIAMIYVINGIPFGVIVSKRSGVDIRAHGSGNTGATNVARVVGKKAGITVLVLDFLKGFIPLFILVRYIFPGEPWVHLAAAVAAILGHCYSVFLNFSGGKASITGLACLFALEPVIAAGMALLVFIIFKISRMVSLAALIAALITPVALYLYGSPLPYTLYGLAAALLLIYRHRSNITRLVQGTENKI
ncbi:MAG: glycerol-3-phosphate 1-O-acyltransferase PlsY [Vampirovibrionales bacterium]|nr:glycerol-3-phosphate 1-O-acyltransferase PlsY [Vampirovibrionales bacterium]